MSTGRLLSRKRKTISSQAGKVPAIHFGSVNKAQVYKIKSSTNRWRTTIIPIGHQKERRLFEKSTERQKESFKTLDIKFEFFSYNKSKFTENQLKKYAIFSVNKNNQRSKVNSRFHRTVHKSANC